MGQERRQHEAGGQGGLHAGERQAREAGEAEVPRGRQQGEGEGEILLRHIEGRARAAGVKRLFVLTTRSSHWYIKRGFTPGGISDLPKSKQTTCNASRSSWIFIKRL